MRIPYLRDVRDREAADEVKEQPALRVFLRDLLRRPHHHPIIVVETRPEVQDDVADEVHVGHELHPPAARQRVQLDREACAHRHQHRDVQQRDDLANVARRQENVAKGTSKS